MNMDAWDLIIDDGQNLKDIEIDWFGSVWFDENITKTDHWTGQVGFYLTFNWTGPTPCIKPDRTRLN